MRPLLVAPGVYPEHLHFPARSTDPQTAFGGGGGGIQVAPETTNVTIERNLIYANHASNGCGIHALAPVAIRWNTIVMNESNDPTSDGGGIPRQQRDRHQQHHRVQPS